jgi:hypothetical protein
VPLDIITTPSDLDSATPGSGRHINFVPQQEIEQHDSGGLSFEDIMRKENSPAAPQDIQDLPPHITDPMGIGTPPPISQPVAQLTDDNLGCLFWGTAFFIPPAGLIWAFLTPVDHDQRGKGIIASSIMLVVAIATFAVSYQMAAQSSGGISDFMDMVKSAQQDSDFDSGDGSMVDRLVNTATQTPVKTVTLHGVQVPLLKGLELVPSSPFQLQEGPMANVEATQLSFYIGSLQTEYMELASDYQIALREAGWEYEFMAGFDGSIGMFTDLYGTANGKDVYLRVFENDTGVFVAFITPTN